MPSPSRPGSALSRRGASLPLPAYPRPAPRLKSRRSARKPRRGIPLTLSLYLTSEILVHFALALAVLVLIYLTVIAFQLMRDGIRLSFVLPHLLRTLPYPLFFAVPISLLLGITLGIGRMATDREMSALRAQGVSHRQIAFPVLGLGILFALLNYYLTGWVLPGVHYEHSNLRETIVNQLHQLGSGSNRTLLLPGSVSLWVKSYDGPRLRGIVLDITRQGRGDLFSELGDMAGDSIRKRLPANLGKITLVAKEADLEVAPDKSRVILGLTGVDLLLPEEVGSPRGTDVFHQKFSVDKLRLPLSFSRRGESVRDMNNPELALWIRSLRDRQRALEEEFRSRGAGDGAKTGDPPKASLPERPGGALSQESPSALQREISSIQRKVARAKIERHGRFAFTLACFTFPLVAYPLVICLERHGRLTHFFLSSLAVVAIFFPLLIAGRVASEGGWPPALAMAFPNAALLLAGAILFRSMASR